MVLMMVAVATVAASQPDMVTTPALMDVMMNEGMVGVGTAARRAVAMVQTAVAATMVCMVSMRAEAMVTMAVMPTAAGGADEFVELIRG